MIKIREQPCHKPMDALGGGRCCCNCKHHFAINGHPWVTGTSILTPTGRYVCTSKEAKDTSRSYIASQRHGLCEEWTKV